jgi:hypothetical protein
MKLKEEERQAAYIIGRCLLLPGSGTRAVKLHQRGIELLWRACTPLPFGP